MASNDVVLVGVATYNELENLPSLVAAIHEHVPDAQVLIVDDNSPDGTGEWCSTFASEHPWFTCIERERKLGLGTALATLMRTALELGVDCLVTLDGDWSHDPRCIPQLVAASQQADVVIGSRYCLGGAIATWSWRRRMLSKLMNRFSTITLGIPVKDCSGNFRLYRASVLKHAPWEAVQATGYAFLEEILWPLQQQGARFIEVPITFATRHAGRSKASWKEGVGALRMLLRLFLTRLK